MPDGKVVKSTFCRKFTVEEYENSSSLSHTNELFFCERNIPPIYKNFHGNGFSVEVGLI